MDAVVIAFAAVFVAELGDKSQLIALTLGARHRPLPVLAGIAVAVAVLQALSVAVGAALSSALPERPMEVVAGLAFLAVAAWTLLKEEDDDDEVTAVRAGRSVAFTAASAFFVAELGDKTMLATLALASANGPFGTWVGATLGEVAADALAVLIGARLGARLPERPLRLISAAAFVVFGVLLLAGVS